MSELKGIIFDLDGVLVTTDAFHYKAWKKLADEMDMHFDEAINEKLRGVSRMESLEIILGGKKLPHDEKVLLTDRKNNYYKAYLETLSDDNILSGALDLITALKEAGLKIAIGSSSKNATRILKQLNMFDLFDAVVDGNHIGQSKPDPEVFLLAAKWLDLSPENCLVFEDAEAGVQAAIAGNMKVIGVGPASQLSNIDLGVMSLCEVSLPHLKNIYK